MAKEKLSFRNALLMGLSDIREDISRSKYREADSRLKTMIDMISLMTEEIDKKTIKLKKVL